MRNHIFTTIALLPLLLGGSQAAQRWTDTPTFGIPSEDSGTSSYLGIDIEDITTDRLGVLKLKEEHGVEVTMVDQDAPAGKAGLREHDVILTMNGTPIESRPQLQRIIRETPPGRVVTLGLSRDGQPLTIKVQLARRSEFAHMSDKDWEKEMQRADGNKDYNIHVEVPPIPNMPDFDMPNIGVVYVHSSVRSGLMVENLTPQLGEFFGAKNGSGVLVRSVEKGSRAERAGLHAGDVITRVGDQPVHDTSDFTHALHAHSAGTVRIAVLRDKKEQILTITLPERKDSGEMFEESLEAPELDAETQDAISKAQDEIAKLRPQMELITAQNRKAYEDLRKSFLDQQKQIKKQMEKVQQELTPEVREEIEKSREKLQQELEKLRREM
jgi:serine protease Do